MTTYTQTEVLMRYGHTRLCASKQVEIGLACTCLEEAWNTIPRESGLPLHRAPRLPRIVAGSVVPHTAPARRAVAPRRSLYGWVDVVTFACTSAALVGMIALLAAWFLDWKPTW